jgi:hypothetical protein
MLIRRYTREQCIDQLLRHLLQPGSHVGRYAGVPQHCMMEYEDYNQRVCRCWLRMYPRGRRVVAIATDLTYRISTGASMTTSVDVTRLPTGGWTKFLRTTAGRRNHVGRRSVNLVFGSASARLVRALSKRALTSKDKGGDLQRDPAANIQTTVMSPKSYQPSL